jgi:hypothetical protein
MYQGALTMFLSTLFWNRCIMPVTLFGATPQLDTVCMSKRVFKSRWLLCVPPGLTFINCTFYPLSAFICCFLDIRTTADCFPIQH